MADYVASALIQAVKDDALIPPSDQTFTSLRVLGFLNREARTYIQAFMRSIREEYQSAFVDVQLVGGQDHYFIPTQASGAKLKLVSVLNSSGTPVPLNKIAPERRFDYTNSGGIDGYTLEGNQVVVLPAPSQPPAPPGLIRFYYFKRVNKVVLESDCGQITAISGQTVTVTFPSTSNNGAWTSGMTFDLVQGQPHFDVLASSLPGTYFGTPTPGQLNVVITLTGTMPTNLAVGDWAAAAGLSPVPNMPVEVADLLAQRVATVVLKSSGDPKWQAESSILVDMQKDVLTLLGPRVEGATSALINYNAPGWNRGLRRGRRRIW